MPRTSSPGAEIFLPANPTLDSLRQAVNSCHGCSLYLHATQAVPGSGPANAGLLLAGEQPGNEEDLQGQPFVGPSGHLLDRALEEAGIRRAEVYVTNAVKHFKFEERGKRRIHKKPSAGEVRACRPWLETEINLVRPKVVGCLGATAAQALLGNEFRLTQHRGQPMESRIGGALDALIVATVHPSAILRTPDAGRRKLEYARFVDDLKAMRKLLER